MGRCCNTPPLYSVGINAYGKRCRGGGWYWTGGDFVFAFILLFGAGAAFELISKKMPKNTTYRFAVGLGVLTAFLLTWINAAVGIIGDNDSANAMYLVLVALGFLGAIAVRFDAQRLSLLLLSMAIGQMIIPVIAFIIWQPPFGLGVIQIFVLNVFFAVLWAGSGLLFRKAVRLEVKKM